MMQHNSGARKREWSATMAPADTQHSNRENPREGGEIIEKEMKRLRLARGAQDETHSDSRWLQKHTDDQDMDDVDMEMDKKQTSSSSSPRCDYRPINLTLRECHYLRQLRRFQAERVSYLERRAPTDAAAAAVIHAMHGTRRR